MVWLSSQETHDRIQQLAHPEKLFRAYALSCFLDEAFYTAGFEPLGEWSEVVALTAYGQDLLADLRRTTINFPRATEHFTFLRLFFHRELLIDHENSDLERILALLREIHRSDQGKWPYVFGHTLYHKFNDSYGGTRTDFLGADSAGGLISGTPQGVFQVGTLLSGPLGFFDSAEQRLVVPTLRLRLWHCSDPGCLAPHIVRLEEQRNSCTEARRAFVRYFLDNLGQPSEWEHSILGIYGRSQWPHGRPYVDLPAALADCIVGSERARLVLRALQSAQNPFLCAALQEARGLRGSPAEITASLSPEEQHQLLLLLPDRDIVGLIDQLVHSGEIKVLPAELRTAKTYAPYRSRDSFSELSSLGIRSSAARPIVELAAHIWNTYQHLESAEDLEWRVRKHPRSTLRHSVIDFIRANGPKETIRDLILASPTVTKSLSDDLYFFLSSLEEESRTCSRLLWKFGFDPARYEDEYQILRNRIARFIECVLQMPTQPSEDDRAEVRAAGVNLFVSVEQFLENMLCYNVWLLTSDHFTGTKFRFAMEDASLAVSRTLGGQIQSGGESFIWRQDGANALGVLVAYLHSFRDWLRERPYADKLDRRRRPDDYPHYAGNPVGVFPFTHVELWADVPAEVMTAVVETFGKICTQIGQAQLSLVRNGLDHKREDGAFPDSDKMLACASRLRDVVETADKNRLIPKLFWLIKKDEDSYGNVCLTFEDYRQATVSIWEPSPVLPGPKKRFGIPYLIAPFDFLGQPNSTLFFVVSPRTEYNLYWQNYPRRRLIPPDVTTVEVCQSRDTQE